VTRQVADTTDRSVAAKSGVAAVVIVEVEEIVEGLSSLCL
jgi:hypothetical protein